MPAKLTSRIPEVIAELPVRAAAGENAGAGVIAEGAKQRAPRIRASIVYPSFTRYPGEMEESISVEQRGELTGVAVGAFWWVFVERGTAHMQAEPFLGPSVDYGEEEAISVIGESFADL